MAAQLSLIKADQKKALEKRIVEVKPLWEKVRLLRHKLIAHRDYSISVSKVFETANVSPKELRSLAFSYCEVLNELIRAIGKKSFDPEDYFYHLFSASDGLFDDLLKAI